MPHTRRYALKLLRQLPDDIAAVLYHQRYWDETFFGVLLERCDEVLFHNPQAGLEIAEAAVELAPKCAKGQRLQELLVRAYAFLGSAYRAASRYEDAETAYEEAERITKTAPISKCDKADLDQRIAYLRSRKGQHEEALRLAEGAVSVLRPAGDKRLDEALVKLGVVQLRMGNHSEAIKNFGEVLTMTGQRSPRTAEGRRKRRVYHCAIHDLAFTLLQTRSQNLRTALKYIREAKRILRSRRGSLAKYKLIWVEGLLLVKIGLMRQAERLFQKARLGFLELAAPFEIALAGLDLSSLYYLDGRWPELESLTVETFTRFRELSADTEAIAALSLWKDAVHARKLADQLISDVKAKVEERMWNYPLAGTVQHRQRRR